MQIVIIDKDVDINPRVSLVVVTNVFPNENLDAMLDSTKEFSFKYETVIVWSNIQHLADVKCHLSDHIKSLPNLVRIKIVLTDVDGGVSYGKNLGAVLAKSPTLLFVDDDVIVTEDIEPLLRYLETNVCQGIQPLTLKHSHHEIVDSAGDFIKKDTRGILYIPYSRGTGKPLNDLREDLFVEEIPSMKGAFMITRKEVLVSVGGFDSTFNFGFEEVDLGWRMVTAGYKLLFVPTVRVFHKGGRSTDPNKRDVRASQMHLVNYYIMNLKITNWVWPYILVQFYRRLLKDEIWNVRRMKAGLADSIRATLIINKLFFERLRFVSRHKRILAKKFRFEGKQKLEELAQGKRFILIRHK